MKISNDYIQKIRDLTTNLEEAIDEKDRERTGNIIEQYTIILGDIEDIIEEEDDDDND